MGLEEVKQDILAAAGREAQRIIDEGNAEAAQLKKEAEKTVEAYRVKRAEDSQRIAQQLERRELAQADFDVKKRMLDKKKEMVERAFAEAEKTLAAESGAARTVVLKKLLAKARKDIPVGSVSVNSKDKKLIKQLAGKLTIKEKSIEGGLIAETADGTVSVNYTYEHFLAEIQEKNLQELNTILFG